MPVLTSNPPRQFDSGLADPRSWIQARLTQARSIQVLSISGAQRDGLSDDFTIGGTARKSQSTLSFVRTLVAENLACSRPNWVACVESSAYRKTLMGKPLAREYTNSGFKFLKPKAKITHAQSA